MSGSFHFGEFALDPADRQLRRRGAPVEISSRYLDALTLLVREAGSLVSKDRFLSEVWRGVPVTDEALTQCVRALRRALGDEAGRPRFIETVPKHGYRFIAAVERVGPDQARGQVEDAPAGLRPGEHVLLAAAGTIGGGMAGFCGGLLYGFAGASQPSAAGAGAASLVLVLLCINILLGLIAGAGVASGMVLASVWAGKSSLWSIGGAAAGGLVIGGLVKLLGLDGFNLLLGQSPGDITGAFEGLMLGTAVGTGAWIAGRRDRAGGLVRSLVPACIAGAAAGLLITLAGGRLMGGSLALLAERFPGSRLRLDRIAGLFGETGFGPVTAGVTGAVEGAVFAVGVVGAMIVASRGFASSGAKRGTQSGTLA
jgi:DNA-binding winged helix-turn-helix (wHTH) protein